MGSGICPGRGLDGGTLKKSLQISGNNRVSVSPPSCVSNSTPSSIRSFRIPRDNGSEPSPDSRWVIDRMTLKIWSVKAGDGAGSLYFPAASTFSCISPFRDFTSESFLAFSRMPRKIAMPRNLRATSSGSPVMSEEIPSLLMRSSSFLGSVSR